MARPGPSRWAPWAAACHAPVLRVGTTQREPQAWALPLAPAEVEQAPGRAPMGLPS